MTGCRRIRGRVYTFHKKVESVDATPNLTIEGFPVQFIPATNDLVREAVENAATLKYRDVEAKVVTAEYLAAIALQTGRAKDRERVIRLLDEAVIDRTVLGKILGSFGLTDKFKKFEKQFHEE